MELKSASLMGFFLRIKENNASKMISTVPGRKQALANFLMYEKHPSAHLEDIKKIKYNKCSPGAHDLVETTEIY